MKQEGADIIIAIAHSGIPSENRAGGEENAAFICHRLKALTPLCSAMRTVISPVTAATIMLAGIDNVKGTLVRYSGGWRAGLLGKISGYIDMTLALNTDGQWQVSDSQSTLKPAE